jgi:hypothetical protein
VDPGSEAGREVILAFLKYLEDEEERVDLAKVPIGEPANPFARAHPPTSRNPTQAIRKPGLFVLCRERPMFAGRRPSHEPTVTLGSRVANMLRVHFVRSLGNRRKGHAQAHRPQS